MKLPLLIKHYSMEINKTTATLLDRTKASTIDTFLLIVMGFMLAEVLSGFEHVATWVRVSLFISIVLYEPVCIAFGATLGHLILNIRVRRSTNDSKKLTIFRSLVRFFCKLLFRWVSYVTVFKNPRKRTLYDLISGATVIDLDGGCESGVEEL